MGLNGLEPSTSRLSGGRSNLLSYKPLFLITPLLCTLPSFYPAGLLLQFYCGYFPLKYYLLYFLRRSYGAVSWLVSYSRGGSPSLPINWPRQLAAGGDNRDRTDDPLLAKQVLSQLSYTPVYSTF